MTEVSYGTLILNLHFNSLVILGERAASAIEWSENLDQVFVQNYNSDPALSWQFFGSSSGVMRHYPGNVPATIKTFRKIGFLKKTDCIFIFHFLLL